MKWLTKRESTAGTANRQSAPQPAVCCLGFSAKDSVKRGTSPADGAMGELLSWVTGKGGKKDKRVQ